jgi:hypothetical protein
MIELSVYGGLFLIALLSASILPLQSEAVLVGLLLSDNQQKLVWNRGKNGKNGLKITNNEKTRHSKQNREIHFPE